MRLCSVYARLLLACRLPRNKSWAPRVLRPVHGTNRVALDFLTKERHEHSRTRHVQACASSKSHGAVCVHQHLRLAILHNVRASSEWSCRRFTDAWTNSRLFQASVRGNRRRSASGRALHSNATPDHSWCTRCLGLPPAGQIPCNMASSSSHIPGTVRSSGGPRRRLASGRAAGAQSRGAKL